LCGQERGKCSPSKPSRNDLAKGPEPREREGVLKRNAWQTKEKTLLLAVLQFCNGSKSPGKGGGELRSTPLGEFLKKSSWGGGKATYHQLGKKLDHEKTAKKGGGTLPSGPYNRTENLPAKKNKKASWSEKKGKGNGGKYQGKGQRVTGPTCRIHPSKTKEETELKKNSFTIKSSLWITKRGSPNQKVHHGKEKVLSKRNQNPWRKKKTTGKKPIRIKGESRVP